MTTSTSSNPLRIKLRGNGHPTSQQQSTAVTKSARPILRVGNKLIKGTAPLPGAGAPKGSQNARIGHMVKRAFTNELARVFKMRSRADTLSGLEAIAAKVIKLARAGSIPAAREVFDRVDGRPAQTIIGDPDNPVFFKNVAEMSDEELEVVARGHVINGTAERLD